MSERYYVMDYESKYELIDKAFPTSGKDGVIAEFYVPNIAYAVCNILNKQATVLEDAASTPCENSGDEALELNEAGSKIVKMCDEIKLMLLEKNRKYGNSALEPVRVFSKSDALEQIRVRMDDKLSRIRNAQADDNEDAYMDLVGYLVLYLVARGRVKLGDDK